MVGRAKRPTAEWHLLGLCGIKNIRGQLQFGGSLGKTIAMRSIPEWIGKSDDDRIPDRVRVRVFARHNGRCHCCGRLILVGEAWELDHVIAIANGGEHRESNLKPILTEHHRNKTRLDTAIKSKSYAVRRKILGLKKPKRPLIGSKASGWKRKMDGTLVRR